MSLRQDRGIAAVQAFFRKALASHPNRPPQKVTLDGHGLAIALSGCCDASIPHGGACTCERARI